MLHGQELKTNEQNHKNKAYFLNGPLPKNSVVLSQVIGESLGNKRVWIIEKGRRERQKTNTKYFHNDGNFLKVRVKAS